MKVTVFYERKNKRLNERKKLRKTIDFPDKDWLWGDDFKSIRDIIRSKCCFPDDALTIRKIKVGQDEYIGCF